MSGKRIADILTKNISMSKQDELDLASALARLEAPGRDVGTVFGRAGAAIQIEAGNVEIDYTKGVVVLNPVTGVPTIELDNLGNAAFGKDLLLPSGTSFSVFSVDQTYNKESVGAGDVLMGDNSTDKANLFWDRSAGTLNLRYGTADSITLGVDGVLTLDKAIRSSNYVAGISGFNIDAEEGVAEFENIIARGSITSSVFVKGMIDARAGTLVVAKSAGKIASDMTVPTSGTWYMIIEDPPGGGFLFTNLDSCRTVSDFSSSIITLDFTVDSRTDMGDGTQRYTCTYTAGDRTAERVYRAGLAVVDYGASGQGYLLMSADDGSTPTQSPYYSVRTWSGTDYGTGTVTERVRLGNMRGAYGAGANDRYGIGIGDYAGGNYLSYNAEGAGTFVLKAGGGAVTIDADGIAIELPTTPTDKNAITFRQDGDVCHGLYSYINDTINTCFTRVGIDAISTPFYSYNHSLYLEVFASSNYTAMVTVGAESYGYGAYLILEGNNSAGKHYANLTGGGLLVGNLTNYTIGHGNIDVQYNARVGGGLYVGSYAGTVIDDAIIADGQGRFGGGLYVGSTGTAPTAKCVHIPGGSLVGTTSASMNDDTAISFTPANSEGFILVWRRSLSVALTVWGLIYYNTSAPFTAIASGGSNLEVTTGALTGTTGTDTKLTVSCHTDGKIYIENRIITGLTVHYLMLGG